MDFSFIPANPSSGNNSLGTMTPSPDDEEKLSIDVMANFYPPILCHWTAHDHIDEGVVEYREDTSDIDAMLRVVRCMFRRIPIKLN